MQGWERAFYIFAQKNDLITIGYQHTIVPELILNYFNHPEEIGKGQDGYIEKCPLPDYLATVGNISAELLRSMAGMMRESLYGGLNGLNHSRNPIN